jgi:hypothetical protein
MAILAYIDPGTGLLAWQALVAAVVGTFFYVKKTRDWLVQRLCRLLRLGKRSNNNPQGTASGSEISDVRQRQTAGSDQQKPTGLDETPAALSR